MSDGLNNKGKLSNGLGSPAEVATALVSIITPTYNHEKYIADCIRSVISQTYQNWEMIIIDDGSTDRTADIINSFLDNRIKYTRQEHLGAYQLGTTYNKAVKQAKGEFIAILEGDDFWSPDKLAVQVPYFADNNVVLTYGNCMVTNVRGANLVYRRIPDDLSVRNNKPIGLSLIKEFACAENFIYAQTVMIRKSALEKIGGFIQPDYLPLIDFPTWCRLSLEGEFRGIPYLLGYWRRSSNSLTFSGFVDIPHGFIRYIREFIRTYTERIYRLRSGKTILDIDALQESRLEQLNRMRLHQNYSKGILLMIYGYNKDARGYFNSYIRSRDKNSAYGFISLLGMLFSVLRLSEIILPYGGYRFSRTLVALKRWLLD